MIRFSAPEKFTKISEKFRHSTVASRLGGDPKERWSRGGLPMSAPTYSAKYGITPELLEAFIHRANESTCGTTAFNDEECWNWNGRDYPYFGYNNQRALVHRLSCTAFVGPITKKRPHVLHKCDNPKCWNPAHLYAGTPAQNIEDRLRKTDRRFRRFRHIRSNWFTGKHG